MKNRLVLASASPRRRELLRLAGFEFTTKPSQIDETPLRESPAKYVRRLALEKAQACAGGREAIVLAADTTVVLGRKILGKPRNRGEAAKMLKQLSGQTHEVLTGYCVLGPHARRVLRVVRTRVTFKELSEREIRLYVRSGEPMDKAGAYAAQGKGMLLIRRVQGSYTNIIGLPMSEVCEDLRRLGMVAK